MTPRTNGACSWKGMPARPLSPLLLGIDKTQTYYIKFITLKKWTDDYQRQIVRYIRISQMWYRGEKADPLALNVTINGGTWPTDREIGRWVFYETSSKKLHDKAVWIKQRSGEMMYRIVNLLWNLELLLKFIPECRQYMFPKITKRATI